MPPKKVSISFDDAVVSHSEWKRKLSAYVANPDQSLSADEIRANDRCKLGKWLKAEGRAYRVFPEFVRLVDAHTRFHEAAAEIVLRANCGEDVRAEFEVGSGTAYSLASSAIVLALMDMKKRSESESSNREPYQALAIAHAAGKHS